jgi:hypothetical protein
MCPQRFVPESYDPEKLHMMQQVFESVWDEFTPRHPEGTGPETRSSEPSSPEQSWHALMA